MLLFTRGKLDGPGRQLFALLEIERAECLQVTNAKVAVASPLLKLFDY